MDVTDAHGFFFDNTQDITMKITVDRYWTLLKKYVQPQWIRIVWLLLLLFVNIALRLANPQIMRTFIDAAVAGNAFADLLRLGLV